MLDCREVTRLVSQGEDRRLALGERVRLRLHFLYCLGCRRVARQLRFLRPAIQALDRKIGSDPI
jgi:hypothetical protein